MKQSATNLKVFSQFLGSSAPHMHNFMLIENMSDFFCSGVLEGKGSIGRSSNCIFASHLPEFWLAWSDGRHKPKKTRLSGSVIPSIPLQLKLQRHHNLLEVTDQRMLPRDQYSTCKKMLDPSDSGMQLDCKAAFFYTMSLPLL